MMSDTALVITSIADDSHVILNQYAIDAIKNNISYIVIGDTKSPSKFKIDGCDYYSIDRQKELGFKLEVNLPKKHYARKNIGYLIAIKKGVKVIVETDDDNLPMDGFWEPRSVYSNSQLLSNVGWVNVYRYFSKSHIWPRGFNLEKIHESLPGLGEFIKLYSPIQQGLADDNPDVDAIYRLTMPLPIKFDSRQNIALGLNSICPFNSQNTTWFKDAFPLLYLPSFCSFRMTDIWRSFIAQRIAWTCGWPIIFHKSTVRQERNEHSLISDFEGEISGYLNNAEIVSNLSDLPLKDGIENINDNLEHCYFSLVKLGIIPGEELALVRSWIADLNSFN